MFQSGSRLPLSSGGSVVLRDEFARGGQAVLYRASTTSGEEVAVKRFLERGRLSDDSKRIEALVGMRLRERCSLLWGPIASVTGPDFAGHVTPFFDGETLEQFLFPSDGVVKTSLKVHLLIAALVAHSVAVLHGLGLSYGDVHPGQFRIRPHGKRLEIAALDFDNFYLDGLPLPAMLGRAEYMSPELRQAWHAKKRAVPTRSADLWSLAALIGVTMLGRDPGPAADPTSTAFHNAVCGAWLDDPRFGDRSKSMDGRPTKVLNRELIELFRRGISPILQQRPSAAEWRRACIRAAYAVGSCSQCNGEAVADSRRRHCPYCRSPLPLLAIQPENGTTIELKGTGMVGRQELGGLVTVSELHCSYERQPPLTIIESVGKNGTYWIANQSWIRLPDQRSFPLQEGDRLRFADVDASIIRIDEME